MAISNNRSPTYTQISDHERPKSGDVARKDMWSSMLDGVASGKRLPEKNILVLGGTSDSQKEFLEGLSSDISVKRGQDRHGNRQPPVANNFALGYTYYDVLDADHEDILARLSLYLLADPSPAFSPLLRPLLTPQTIPNTIIVILLDWSQPWLWLRQLRDWIRLLRTLLVSLDQNCKEKMEEVMVGWRSRGRSTTSLDGGGGGNTSSVDGDVTLPLGPGEWEEALGLPLCVVCQNSDHIEVLERERAWKEEEFDFVLQFLRTVLLKHGASLIYTIPSVPSPLQSLIHSSLGIQSLLRKQPLKHNVIDRDKVVLPPNWDSWGKIRVLREGFDVEGVNKGWSVDIEELIRATNGSITQVSEYKDSNDVEEGGALAMYEETIRDPSLDSRLATNANSARKDLEFQSVDAQTYLAIQLDVLERIRHGADAPGPDNKRDTPGHKISQNGGESPDDSGVIEEGRVNEHIGPVQFNMGGIQVDADDMLQRLKNRQSEQTPDPETPGVASPDGKAQNEALASFFAGLMNRGGGAATSSPKSGAS